MGDMFYLACVLMVAHCLCLSWVIVAIIIIIIIAHKAFCKIMLCAIQLNIVIIIIIINVL